MSDALVIPGDAPRALMRFIVRNPHPSRDGLILACRIHDDGLLRADRVYELRQMFGEYQLVDVGTSRVARGGVQQLHEVGATWERDVNALLREFQGRLWVPREFDEPEKPDHG